MTMEPTRVEQLVDDEWKPVHGITNVVIYDEEVGRAIAERIREVNKGLIAIMRAYARALTPAVAELGRALQAMREAELIGDDGKPVKRSDRPAWQSPYGPAQRRH